ncbi:hypothetical protein MRX96_050013 [Rhipicephalus microplus]
MRSRDAAFLKEYTKGNPAAMVEILQVLKQKNLIHTVNSTTTSEARLKREFTLAKEDEHELREHRPGRGIPLTVVRMEMLNEQEIVLLKKGFRLRQDVRGVTPETAQPQPLPQLRVALALEIPNENERLATVEPDDPLLLLDSSVATLMLKVENASLRDLSVFLNSA